MVCSGNCPENVCLNGIHHLDTVYPAERSKNKRWLIISMLNCYCIETMLAYQQNEPTESVFSRRIVPAKVPSDLSFCVFLSFTRLSKCCVCERSFVCLSNKQSNNHCKHLLIYERLNAHKAIPRTSRRSKQQEQ